MTARQWLGRNAVMPRLIPAYHHNKFGTSINTEAETERGGDTGIPCSEEHTGTDEHHQLFRLRGEEGLKKLLNSRAKA